MKAALIASQLLIAGAVAGAIVYKLIAPTPEYVRPWDESWVPTATEVAVMFSRMAQGTSFAQHEFRSGKDQVIDGRGGVDTIEYSKPRDVYIVEKGQDNSNWSNVVIVFDTDNGDVDAVANVENFHFADMDVGVASLLVN